MYGTDNAWDFCAVIILHPTDKYDKLDSEEFRQFYSRYTIQVGSTGNLGLSIGIMGASLGFRVIVHMSREAKEWKKELLREKGVIVLEYDGDYSHAVAEGRNNSAKDPNSFFIDDENSEDLFFGYATAGMRLKMQLYKAGVSVDRYWLLFSCARAWASRMASSVFCVYFSVLIESPSIQKTGAAE